MDGFSFGEIDDRTGDVGAVSGFCRNGRSKNHFGQRRGVRIDKRPSEGGGFRGRKSKSFHERRNDDRIGRHEVFAQFAVRHGPFPNDAVGYAEFRDFAFHYRHAFDIVARDDAHGLEMGDFLAN